MAKITFRIWLLIIVVALSLISIFSLPPIFLEKGVVVKSVEKNSTIFEQGLRQGMVITSINNQNIETFEDYTNAMESFVESITDEKAKLEIITNEIEVVNLFSEEVVGEIVVEEIPNTRIKTGLDLQGGARALVKADVQLTEEQLNDLISVSEQRLNVYGLSDVKFFKVTQSTGEKLMGVEIAGSTSADLEDLIAQQGKFEAKIGNETVFVGGDEDITHVGRTGQDAIIDICDTASDGTEFCNFKFVIFLSEEAAQRHAEITDQLEVNGSYLSKTIDFYIDGLETSSLNIGSDLKGNVATQIQISGSESGLTRKEAIDNTKLEMKKLQTILITGSLPYKLEIVKIDRISPRLGEQFTKQILMAGLFAVIAVSLLVFIRYRKIKASIALISVSLSEVLIILGVATLIGWNLDLPSIAGIIAAIGTGIDSQLVILDEARDHSESIKQRIKKALFIIVTAFTTTFVALIPLTGFLGFMGIGAASAGLLKGFAITTLIGITTGVLISRPAFADIARQLEGD
jgi:preprotein translocase subunit SecD